MIGKTILHYNILRKLGSGGMGDVYLAEDTKLRRPVALKILPAELSSDPQRKRRFLQEAHAASILTHPHICVATSNQRTWRTSAWVVDDLCRTQIADSIDLQSPRWLGHQWLGFAYSLAGRQDDYVAEAKKAISTSQAPNLAHANLAFALRKAGRKAEAAAEAQRVRATKDQPEIEPMTIAGAYMPSTITITPSNGSSKASTGAWAP